ncbi:MAG TPA: hypothetical protein VKA49_18500 [Flavitalea sp.]|nr:hypothetical protein [Flavitalea sp.]
MSPNNRNKSADRINKPQQAKVKPDTPEDVKAAHDQAEKDIEKDADLSIHSPNDDLDEGETARLGEEKTDLV